MRDGEPMAGPAGRVVVWRVGDATLAVPLDDTVEIAPVVDGRAVTRSGPLSLRTPAGLARPGDPQHAVVVRTGGDHAAMAADAVEGVHEGAGDRTAALPPWLLGVSGEQLAGLIRLDDDRIAALLHARALGPG